VAERHAIVIFGAAVRRGGRPSRTLRRRISAALAVGRKLPDPLYVPTGGVGQFYPSEAATMGRVLRQRGVRPERIVLEETATDTLSSVRAVRRILRGRGFRGRVFIATSAFHMPRCWVLMRAAGFRVRACPTPRVPASRNPWRRWFWRLREIPALPYDLALLLWLRLWRRL
jgi:uncharacterized SAM-binding protein YcdF (DUF218 family)